MPELSLWGAGWKAAGRWLADGCVCAVGGCCHCCGSLVAGHFHNSPALILTEPGVFPSCLLQVEMVKDADAQRQVCKDTVAEAIGRNNK